MVKVGYAEGECPRCGKKHVRPRPIDYAYCDCWKYCPFDHGKGPYATEMEEFTPGTAMGVAYDSERGLKIVHVCKLHDPPYYSEDLPVEVILS